MGIGFVIFLHLIAVGLLALVIAIGCAVVVFFAGGREKRKRKLALAFMSPFVWLFTAYFTALTGAIVVSGLKDVDPGIGDSWYVPLTGRCRLVMVDLPSNSFVECGNETVEGGISALQLSGDTLIARRNDSGFFALYLATGAVTGYDSEEELRAAHPRHGAFVETSEFHRRRWREIAGTPNLIVLIIAILLPTGLVIVICRSVLAWRIAAPKM